MQYESVSNSKFCVSCGAVPKSQNYMRNVYEEPSVAPNQVFLPNNGYTGGTYSSSDIGSIQHGSAPRSTILGQAPEAPDAVLLLQSRDSLRSIHAILAVACLFYFINQLCTSVSIVQVDGTTGVAIALTVVNSLAIVAFTVIMVGVMSLKN